MWNIVVDHGEFEIAAEGCGGYGLKTDSWRLSPKAVQAALFITVYREMAAVQQPFRLLSLLSDNGLGGIEPPCGAGIDLPQGANPPICQPQTTERGLKHAKERTFKCHRRTATGARYRESGPAGAGATQAPSGGRPAIVLAQVPLSRPSPPETGKTCDGKSEKSHIDENQLCPLPDMLLKPRAGRAKLSHSHLFRSAFV